MFINVGFNYAGINSYTKGVYIVRSSEGLIQGQFGINRSTIKDNIPNNPIPQHYGMNYDSRTFTLEFYIEGEWTSERRREICTWLFQDNFEPLYSEDAPDIIYRCKPIGKPERYFTGNFEGYIRMEFECDAPWGFSPIMTNVYDLTNNTTTHDIYLDNCSNLNNYKHYPEVQVELYGDATGFSLTNVTNGGLTQTFTGLQPEEKIYINNKKKQIKSSLPNVYRYTNFNRVWLELVYGLNQITVTGKCTIKVRSIFPVIE